MVIKVSAAINADTATKVFVNRATKGAYVDGLYVPGTNTRFAVLASVQQPTPKQLEILPEGDRDKDTLLFITKRKLQTTNDGEGLIADSVEYENSKYRLVQKANWDLYGQNGAFGVRVDE